ncbi:MAG: ATP-binding protein [Rhodospirillaceae bacterium]|nr:ATP-binding protein [Rhodospirillaceae bacterium]
MFQQIANINNFDASLLQEKNEQLSKRLPINLIANAICVLAFLYIFRGTIPAIKLFGWAVVSQMVNLSGLALVVWWRKAANKDNQRRWLLLITVYVFFDSLVWGYAAWSFFLANNYLLILFLSAAIMGVASGGQAAMQSYLPAATMFIIIIIIPLSARFLLAGNEVFAIMGSLTFVLIFVLLSVNFRANENLREVWRLRHEVETANRAKSDFLANMSHELRTPLNAIIGFSDSVRSGVLPPEKQNEYLGDIKNSGEHLLKLINDILDISAIEVRKISLNNDTFNVKDLAASVYRTSRLAAENFGVGLDFEYSGPHGQAIGDERRIKQIMMNLLSNAIKFTPHGGSVKFDVGVNGDKNLVIRVVDSGIGMDEDGLKTALMPFGQVASPFARSHKGTGLGLPLSKELCEILGGTFKIESTPAVGTKVEVTLPLKYPSQTPA